MDKKLVPFWEEAYQNTAIHANGYVLWNAAFCRKADWKAFLNKAKASTNIGCIHMMQIFTDMVPASEDIAPFAVGLAKDWEIKELYNDWEILQFKSYTFEDEHPGVPKHSHASNKIVARRIS